MKLYPALILLLISGISASAQLGLHAGSYKKWLKKEVEIDKEASFFNGHKLGASMTIKEDAEIDYFLYVYEKGNTSIVLLVTKIKDAMSYIIQDIIEIKNLRSIDNIQTGSCSINNEYDARIVVLEKNTKGKPVNTKAWRVDIDRLHFKSITARGINCLIEGAD